MEFRHQVLKGLPVILLACSVVSAPAPAQFTQQGGNEPSPSLVDAIKDQMSQVLIPGASIAVIKDYRIKWAMGFGLADVANNVPVTIDTLFQAASVSKPHTAIATMITLAGLGPTPAVDVNKIFAKVPPAPDVGYWRLPTTYPTPATVAMLLAHIGGTNDFRYKGYQYGYYEQPPAPIDAIPNMHQELYGLPPANTPAIEVVRPPGVTWVYSPAGYTVLQAMLMNIYRTLFANIMAKLVLQPFDMTHSTFLQPTPPSLTPSIAVPYNPIPVGAPQPVVGYEKQAGNDAMPNGPLVFDTAASGGLTTTPTDLAKMIIAFQKALAGQRQGYLTPQIAQAMMVRQPGTIPTSPPCPPNCNDNWGLGFNVNLNKYYHAEPDENPTGNYFGFTGFNSGYLTFVLGSKTGGHGLAIQENAAPLDMSTTNIPEGEFMLNVIKLIADAEQWP